MTPPKLAAVPMPRERRDAGLAAAEDEVAKEQAEVDCGPAALKLLLEGFGIGVSYGRLREACQTGLDGTSIDTIDWMHLLCSQKERAGEHRRLFAFRIAV